MVSKNTVDVKIAYQNESTNYCSGTGSTKNTPTELVEGDLTASDNILSFNPGIPKPVKKNIWKLNSTNAPAETVFSGYEVGKGSLVADLQTDDYYDIAIAGTVGAIPTSIDWRFDDDTGTEKDVYGSLITKYELKAVAGSGNPPVTQSIDFISAQSKVASTTPIAGGGIPAFQSGSRGMWSSVSATIDSKTSANLVIKEITETITKKYKEDTFGVGIKYVQEPVLEEIIPTIAIVTIEEASNTWFADEMNETDQLVSGSIVWHSTLTSTFANFSVKKTNIGEIEGRGLILNKYEFEGGVGWTLS